MTRGLRLLWCLALGVGGCGGGQDAAGVPPPSAPPPAPSPTGEADAEPDRPRGTPRWEPVDTFAGEGPRQSRPFTIASDAIQWRIRWRCSAGTLQITTTPAPRRPAPVVEAAPCPGEGEGFAIHTGAITLGVEASGPWEAVVEQQVDTPLDEPPPEGSSTGTVVTQGDFYDVENPGRGRALVLALGDGRRVLRLEEFETLATPELFVWLSQASNPRTSLDAVEADHVELAPLRSSLGNQNYDLPADLPLDAIRSVVIWCEPVGIVYTAAALSATRA